MSPGDECVKSGDRRPITPACPSASARRKWERSSGKRVRRQDGGQGPTGEEGPRVGGTEWVCLSTSTHPDSRASLLSSVAPGSSRSRGDTHGTDTHPAAWPSQHSNSPAACGTASLSPSGCPNKPFQTGIPRARVKGSQIENKSPPDPNRIRSHLLQEHKGCCSRSGLGLFQLTSVHCCWFFCTSHQQPSEES